MTKLLFCELGVLLPSGGVASGRESIVPGESTSKLEAGKYWLEGDLGPRSRALATRFFEHQLAG